MKYINTITGAIIDSPCLISGENWELVIESKSKNQKGKKKEVEEVEDTEEVE